MTTPISDPRNPANIPDSPEEISHGAHGRYGVEEEPTENSEPLSHVPKSAEEIARDRERDAETKNTGEDLGRG
jgi:hypothetical protein